jgi:hypothetical protein
VILAYFHVDVVGNAWISKRDVLCPTYNLAGLDSARKQSLDIEDFDLVAAPSTSATNEYSPIQDGVPIGE